MIRKILCSTALIIDLSGCASPESQLREGLHSAGLPPALSDCMAHRMTPQLSVGELLKLRSLGSLPDQRLGGISADKFMHKVRALQDPHILAVAGSSAFECALR